VLGVLTLWCGVSPRTSCWRVRTMTWTSSWRTLGWPTDSSPRRTSRPSAAARGTWDTLSIIDFHHLYIQIFEYRRCLLHKPSSAERMTWTSSWRTSGWPTGSSPRRTSRQSAAARGACVRRTGETRDRFIPRGVSLGSSALYSPTVSSPSVHAHSHHVCHQDLTPIPPKPLFITPSLSDSLSFRRLFPQASQFCAKGPIAIFNWRLWPREPDPRLPKDAPP
jgi:hypothetical protein